MREHFGESAPFAILLQGPPGAIERQGPQLVEELHREVPQISTLSPWDRGSVGPLRPGPRRALIIADFHVDLAHAVNDSVDRLNSILAHSVKAPVRATQTSYATLSREIQDRSIDAAERSELIALPILLIVLLLVFRSPIAAAIPLVFGAATVAASRGLLYLIAGTFEIDAFALTVCTMMGLALGVDYALLMVSRFREEIAGGAEPALAAARTRRTAGRTTVFAGSTLLVSMVVAFFIVPGSLLASLAATVALVVVLSVAIATIAGPALLALLGTRIDRWRIGAPPAEDGGALMTFVSASLKRPLAAALAIGALVLVLAAPALGLQTGPPSPSQLPDDNPARQDSELIAEQVGTGFESPFVLIAASHYGPITNTSRLDALSKLQANVAKAPGVQAVIGPARITKAVAPLKKQGNELLDPSAQLAQISRLSDGLSRARAGVAAVRGGISEASQGAGLLAGGSGRAKEGADLLARGLGRAGGGTEKLLDALGRFRDGTERLTGAQERVVFGTLQLKTGLHELAPNLRRNALSRSRALQRSLNEQVHEVSPQLLAEAQATASSARQVLQELEAMEAGKADPLYGATVQAAKAALLGIAGSESSAPPPPTSEAGLIGGLTKQQTDLEEDAAESTQVSYNIASSITFLKRLSAGAEKLADSAQQILAADKELERGSKRLVEEVEPVGGQIEQLASGATRLAAGIAQITGGARALEENLAAGFSRSYPLEVGLRRAGVRVLASGDRLRRGSGRLRHGSPHIFDSGYFVLSALDGAPPELRERAAEAVDLKHSGQAAAMLVFSRYALNTPGSIDFQAQLEDDARDLSKKTGLQTGVAGGPAVLNDYSAVTRDRIPLVVAAITLTTFLILILILRAIPLAALAVGLNLATVGVAFGILTLLTDLPASVPLGGHEYVDSVGATMIFGIVFGLSIDYAVFLLVRMREHYDRKGDHRAAITFGLEKTARVITGAAAIMLAVFVVFGSASIATVSQLGIGLTVAVFIDATVVRIVLLPALMLMIGERVWWLPKWLDRAMPSLNV